ncbi:MAG TPA: sigma-70 family RNA polymerase sigma factor [Arachidicoccus sp.]
MNLTQTFIGQILPLKDKLLRVAFSIVRQMEEAEDIVQDVMLKIWDKRDEWIKLNSCEAYCMVMTRNMSIDFLRRKKMQLQPLEGMQVVPSKDENPLEKMAGKETFSQIQQAMQSLPEKQFISIQLREVEGKAYNEIAEILGIPITQVKVNIHRARNSIRQQLLKQFNHGL